MARKYHEIKGLAEFTAKAIVSDEQEWKKFLHTAGHMYKYPFREQMLIYAQRPDATACASLELWNEKMNCWVNKGAQGIALIDEEGVHRSGLKYVFDVKDVHEARFIGRKPTLWKMEDEHKDYVIDSLERIYGETDASRSFESRIMELANRIASEMAPEVVSDQLAMSVEGSFLEGLDELNLEVRPQQTLAASIAYTALERCGMDPENVEGIDFPYLHEFNTIESLSVMGDSASELTAPILREIGRSISVYERERDQEAVRNAYEEYIGRQSEEPQKGLANASERGYNALTPSGEEQGNEYIESAKTSAERSDYA
ncbi:MAG: helicase SNF2, partial [Lachnospiraceae bacterium]|nr:helicase SNF2 [Lachnospiraceae bacterium]